jgi:hypothetical protein
MNKSSLDLDLYSFVRGGVEGGPGDRPPYRCVLGILYKTGVRGEMTFGSVYKFHEQKYK